MKIVADIVKDTLSDFWERLKTIAVDGSGIPPRLWDANATPLSNFHIDTDGTVTHPLYESLGWHFARFSYAANEKSKDFGIALTDYRGDTWQVVLPDESARGYRYLAPKGIGNRAWFPALNQETIAKICARYGIDTPGDGADYWEYFKSQGIPLIVTEGAKKALATLGQGILCCALYGNACLKSPDLEGWGKIQIAMDQDSGFTSKGENKRDKTYKSVLAGSKYLREKGVKVSYIVWDPRDGKGLDDLLVHSPAKFWEAINNPVAQLWSMKESIALDIHFDYLIESTEELENLLGSIQGRLIILDAPTGSGKTESMRFLASDRDRSHIGLSPLRSLCHGMADTLDLGIFNESDRRDIDDRVALCINSAFKVHPARQFNLYIDEYEAGLDSLYRGNLCRKGRSERIAGFEKLVRNADRIFAMSATALPRDIKKLEQITGEKAVRIRFTPSNFKKAPIMLTIGNGEQGSNQTAFNLVLESLGSDIKAGLRAIVSCDNANSKGASEIGLMGSHAWGLAPEQILIYSRDTLNDDRVQAFRSASDKGAWLAENGIRLFCYSPIMSSGVSIKDPQVQLFDTRYAFINANSIAPAQSVQLLNRYRSSLPIIAFCAIKGTYTPLLRGNAEEIDRYADRLNQYLGGGFGIDRYALECDRALGLQFLQYGEAFRHWIERDGHDLTVDQVGHIEELTRPNLSNEIRQWRAAPIVSEGNLYPISPSMARILSDKPEPTVAESLRLKAYHVREFCGLTWDQAITIEDVILEEFGRGTKRLNLLANMLFPEGEKAEFLHDANLLPLRSELWEKLGIFEILAYCLKNSYSQNDPTIRSWWDSLSLYADEFAKFPRLLGFKITLPGDYATAIKAIGMMLRALGFRTQATRSRGNNLIRTYNVCSESIAQNAERLARLLCRMGKKGDPDRGKALYSALDHLSSFSNSEANLGDPHPKTTPKTTPKTASKPDPHIQT